MNLSFGNIKNFFKERRLRDLSYILGMLLFFAICAWAFLWAVFFLVSTIDSVTGTEAGVAVQPTSVDLIKFSAVASRLRVPFSLPKRGVDVKPTIESSSLTPQAPEPPAPVEQVEPEVVLEPDLSQVKAQILNGTTIKGLAKTWKGYLEGEGFSNVAVGNAARRNYTGVTLQYKLSAQAALERVKKVVASHDMSISSENAEAESTPYDITVIIGK